MKNTTRKLLLCLYQSDSSGARRVQIPGEAIDIICPGLSRSGRKSLLRLLVRRGWVLQLPQTDGGVLLSLTGIGKTALEAKIPALRPNSQVNGRTWTAILFCQSSKRDPQFRNLRRIIVTAGGTALSRGMYLFPGKVPNTVSGLVSALYQKNVSMFTIGQWLFGKDPDNLVNSIELKQAIDTFSSVSKEASELLSILESENSLNSKRKRQLSSLVDRLQQAVESELFLSPSYLPEEIDLQKPIIIVQTILRQLFSTEKL